MLRAAMTRFHYTLLLWVLACSAICILSAGALRWALLTLCCTLCGLLIGLGVSFPQLQMFGPSLCCVNTDRRAIALTFDDGPDPEVTPVVLDCLARHGLTGTFFCVGSRVRQHPELARRIVAEGHGIENHSFAHSHWTNLFSVRRLRDDVCRAQREIGSASGKEPMFFRPPVGLTNLRIFMVARELGLQVAGYTVRALDRRNDKAERIISRLTQRLAPGAILLLHDSEVAPAKAEAIISGLARVLSQERLRSLRLDELVAVGHQAVIATSCTEH
jgi:peptidoglycan-N-acetylglucosamine deacetylase